MFKGKSIHSELSIISKVLGLIRFRYEIIKTYTPSEAHNFLNPDS